MHVLIVEDDMLIALSIQALLEELGAVSSQIVSSEQAAVAQARLYEPNLIISDLYLSEGLGATAVQAIRSSVGPVPTLYVTAAPDEALRRDPEALVLSKPLTKSALVAALQHLRPLISSKAGDG